MGKIRGVEITQEQRRELERGYRLGKTHSYRMRCQVILLKSQGRTSKEVADMVKMNQVTVNSWLNRYEKEGIKGLTTKAGRGRKSVLDPEKDADKVRKAIQQERQRLGQAKLLLEQELDKEFSLKTLKRFLKKLSADIGE